MVIVMAFIFHLSPFTLKAQQPWNYASLQDLMKSHNYKVYGYFNGSGEGVLLLDFDYSAGNYFYTFYNEYDCTDDNLTELMNSLYKLYLMSQGWWSEGNKMEEKLTYEVPELEIIKLSVEETIIASGGGETPILKPKQNWQLPICRQSSADIFLLLFENTLFYGAWKNGCFIFSNVIKSFLVCWKG